MTFVVRILVCSVVLLAAFGLTCLANDDGPVQSGYAIVTPTPANTSGLVVFETFGHMQGGQTTQAGVLPSEMTTRAFLFVNANGRLSRNLGVAIANPGSDAAMVTLTLRGEDGTVLGEETITVDALNHVAQFVTQMFAGQPDVPKDFTGTLLISSDAPVAVIGLRFRGVNFSTIPITNLSESAPVPEVAAGVGGEAAAILAHFATGGGWASEIVIANSGTEELTVRLDLFKQDGSPLTARLNGQSNSSFLDLAIPPGGVITLAPRGDDGESDF